MKKNHSLTHYMEFIKQIQKPGVCLTDMLGCGITYPTLLSYRKKFAKAGLIYTVKEGSGNSFNRVNIYLTQEGKEFVERFKVLKKDILKSLFIKEDDSNGYTEDRD